MLTSEANEQEFTRLLATVRERLGSVESSEQQGWQVNINNGVHSVSLTYGTTYTNGSADEQFVYIVSGEEARLAGYHINSMALLADPAIDPNQPSQPGEGSP